MDNQQVSQEGSQLKRNPLQNYSNPKKIGITALIMAIVSLFIFGTGFSMIAILGGIYGTYLAIKKKAGAGVIILNVLAIIIGFASRVLLEIL